MAAYLAMCAEPIVPNVGENTITIQSGKFPAVVGQFIVRPILINGGVQNHLMGEVIVQKSSLPAGTVFVFGQTITATQIGGTAHNCLVHEMHDTFAEWRLQLMDVNEGA